jgi:chromosome partitioning protein
VAIIAVTGRKGGIGKSTLTANLAAEFAALGQTVAVLDTDPQQSLVAWARLGTGFLATCVRAVETTHPERFQAAVRTAAQTATRVLIDTPPGFADPALLAALLADLVLLPAGPSPLDMLAAREALALTRAARAQRGGQTPLIRFVPSKVQAHTTLSRDLAASLAGFGELVLPAIGQRVAVAEAALHGLTVREYAPGSAAHAEFVALAHAVEEVLSLCLAKPA